MAGVRDRSRRATALLLVIGLLVAVDDGRRRQRARGERPAEAAAALELARRPELRLAAARPADLALLPGFGPVLAARILAQRDRLGARDVDALSAVPGLGHNRLAVLRRHLAPEPR